jgi:hypothetical protein
MHCEWHSFCISHQQIGNRNYGTIAAVEQIPPRHNGLPATFGGSVPQYPREPRGSTVNPSEPDAILPFKDWLDMAERELSAFFAVVETVFGAEQAKLSVEDWLAATEHVLGPNQPTSRDWRAVTIVASSRLAHRLAVARGNAGCLPDSARSKKTSIVWESSNIDLSPR